MQELVRRGRVLRELATAAAAEPAPTAGGLRLDGEWVANICEIFNFAGFFLNYSVAIFLRISQEFCNFLGNKNRL